MDSSATIEKKPQKKLELLNPEDTTAIFRSSLGGLTRGAILASAWRHLGPFRPILAPSWRHLGPF